MKKYLLIYLSALFFAGCASVSPTAYVDKLLDQGEYAELYYYVVIANDKNVDQLKFKNAILSKTGGAKNPNFFNLAVKQINTAYHPHVDYFIDTNKFIQEALGDILITQTQAQQLNEILSDSLDKNYFNIPEITSSTAIATLWPDAKAKSDKVFRDKLNDLSQDTDPSIESFFPIYNYFLKSNNSTEATRTLNAMQILAEKHIASSQNPSDLNPVIKYIQTTGDRSLDAKITSAIQKINPRRSEINSSIRELFPEFYRNYTYELRKQSDIRQDNSSILIEACNGIQDEAKRLSCLQEVISRKSATLTQTDNGIQDLKKAFASISGAVNAGINFQRYQAIALEPSKAVSVLKATNKNIEPDAMEYLTKSAEAYKDAEIFWRAYIYKSQDGGVMFGRVFNYRLAGLDWLVKKYQLPTNTVLFNENVPLNPSLTIIWREAEANASKAMELLDN